MHVEVTVWLEDRARAVIERETSERRFLETGGSVFGWADADDVVVACASGPGERAKHRPRSFEPDPQTTFSVMQAVHTSSEGRYGYLGSWHTHPGGSVVPSALDKQTARGMATNPELHLARPLLLIVSTSFRRRDIREIGAWHWSVEAQALQAVEVMRHTLDEYYGPDDSALAFTGKHRGMATTPDDQ